jgi:ubiquinone/menaquinone biosynthesis C-methylase UbiE
MGAIPVSVEDFWVQERSRAKCRHDWTQIAVKRTVGDMIASVAPDGAHILDIGAERGEAVYCYRRSLGERASATIYDWKDWRAPFVKEEVGFSQVDLEQQPFPHPDATFDVVVINQVLEHLKNIYLPLSEIHRVLRPGGHAIVSVPNVTAFHNVVLCALGQQPTTTALCGSHVRGFSIWGMHRFLQLGGHFKVVELRGIGLHPFTSAALPRWLLTYCHTPVWLLQRMDSQAPSWRDLRESTFTTTNF